jgi:hypothetical protein
MVETVAFTRRMPYLPGVTLVIEKGHFPSDPRTAFVWNFVVVMVAWPPDVLTRHRITWGDAAPDLMSIAPCTVPGAMADAADVAWGPLAEDKNTAPATTTTTSPTRPSAR